MKLLLRGLVSVIALFFTVQAQAAPTAQPLSALTFRMAGDELRTRIVVMFDREPELSTFLLENPHRLVIDLPETRIGFDGSSLGARGLVSDARFGLVGEGRSRLILTLRGPFKVEDLLVLKNENALGYRLVADIVASSDREFAAELKSQNTRTGSTQIKPNADRVSQSDLSDLSVLAKPFTVMIDAGHGGIDSGAEGIGGIREKDITLAFAREFRDRLATEAGVRVLMTRDDDSFLRLGERVRLARQYEADLFVSIHADTVSQRNIRGATVYTISDKASDEVARAMAERENKADALAGIVHEEQPEVTDILLDLTRRETHMFSLNFAAKVIHSFEGEINLINNPHRFAGFQVLRAPDVPSVLLELGYLSNREDEKLITDPSWRKRVAEQLVIAVKKFSELKNPSLITKG